jgi:uncharacterized protein
VGNEYFRIGDIFSGIDKPEIQRSFAAKNVYSKEECRNCWAKFYCSGGCAANAFNQSGDILSVYKIGCELQKKRIECGIYLSAVKALEDSEKIAETVQVQ